MALSLVVSKMNKTWRKFCFKDPSRGLRGPAEVIQWAIELDAQS